MPYTCVCADILLSWRNALTFSDLGLLLPVTVPHQAIVLCEKDVWLDRSAGLQPRSDGMEREEIYNGSEARYACRKGPITFDKLANGVGRAGGMYLQIHAASQP